MTEKGSADPPPLTPEQQAAEPLLSPPLDFARLTCPNCGRVLRFEARAAYGTETGWAYDCSGCRRWLGRVVVLGNGMTRLRLACG